jgi:hypothetical protein
MNPFRRAAGISARTTTLLLMLAPIALLAVSPPPAVGATPVTWLVPAGGETWTAGTTHTLEWSGGDPSVFAIFYIQQFAPFGQAVVPGMAFFPNNGHGIWVLTTDPTYLPPGTYKLGIGIQGDTNGPYYSNTFTIQPAPECLAGCERVSASFPGPDPFYSALPIGACASGPLSASTSARTYIETHLASQCPSGYSLDPGSVVIDVTPLPFGACLFQESSDGLFIAEASGLGCCCQDPVSAKRSTWGTLKAIYR